MWNFYYFNIHEDNKGNHEVHVESCDYLPKIENRKLIGYRQDCKTAIHDAQIAYPNYKFDGCYYCCRDCHKG